jgi:AcrR family transcriptional regulator
MVNPIVQTSGNDLTPSSRTIAPRPRRTDGAATRALILQAARQRLCDGGYAKLNVRDIARDAGVNHALINYHFQGKQQLVLAVLDEANSQLLERQTRMYSEPVSVSRKWRQACEFYEQDLQSGFVRLMMELMAASFTDDALRREFVPRFLAWSQVVDTAVGDTIERYDLKLPVPRSAITAWIVSFWIGMEANMTLGITEKQGHFREALKAMADLLRLVEARQPAPGRSSRSKR